MKYEFSDPEIVDVIRQYVSDAKKDLESHGLIPTADLILETLNHPNCPEENPCPKCLKPGSDWFKDTNPHQTADEPPGYSAHDFNAT